MDLPRSILHVSWLRHIAFLGGKWRYTVLTTGCIHRNSTRIPRGGIEGCCNRSAKYGKVSVLTAMHHRARVIDRK